MISASNEKFNFSYYEFFSDQFRINFEQDSLSLQSPNAAINLETDYDFELCELLYAIFKGILISKIFI